MHTVQFNSHDGFRTFDVIPDDKKVYSDVAVVENVENDLYAVVIDYDSYDSFNRSNEVSFVDAFSTIDRAEALALMIKRAMDNTSERDLDSRKKLQDFGVDYENDSGRMVRCGLSTWFGWGSSFQGVAIVKASNRRLRQEGIEYR